MSHPKIQHNGKQNSEGPVETPFGRPPKDLAEMPFNPFRNNSAPVSGAFEHIRIALMLPIFLVRLVLLLTLFILGYLFTKVPKWLNQCWLSDIFVAYFGPAVLLNCKPFPPWRRTLLWPVRYCARGVLFACGFQWIKVKGRPAPRDVAPILVSNHCSFADPIFIFYAFLPIIMTAKENIDIPIAGAIQEALQCIPVDRSSPTSRRDAAGEVKRRAVCNDWSHVAIFPEATTTNGRALVSFKTGAFACGLPIQPLVVRYPHVRMDPSWVVDGPPVHLLLLRLMMEWHNYMEVEYLPVVHPSLHEVRDMHAFAQRTRLVMARALNVHLTDHAFGDVALAVEAVKLRAPPAVANVEFGRMEQLGLDLKEAKGLLRIYMQMEGARSGRVSRKGYAGSMHLPADEAVGQSFGVFDTKKSGGFSFREYLAGVGFMRQHPGAGKVAETVFEMWDSDMSGELTPQKVLRGLLASFPGVTHEQGAAIFESMGGATEGIVSWNEFGSFLGRRPEYVAALACSKPSILSRHKKEVKVETDGSG